MKLSVVINTKNAGTTLERTLKSVKSIVDSQEIIIVDMHSSDDTLKIAKKYTSKVFNHKDLGYVEPARNFALSKAKGAWILIIDADEEITSELKKMLVKIIDEEVETILSADCYWIARKNLVFNTWVRHTGWWPDYQLRFFKNGYVSWQDEIHSIPITTGEVKQLPAKEELALVHHNYQTVEQFVDRLNRYTSQEAKTRKLEQMDDGFFSQFAEEFLSRYFAKQGYKDGRHGISLSLMQSLYEVVVQAKLWQNQDFSHSHNQTENEIKALRQFIRDCKYWLADYEQERAKGLKKLYWGFRQRFRV